VSIRLVGIKPGIVRSHDVVATGEDVDRLTELARPGDAEAYARDRFVISRRLARRLGLVKGSQ
jgi:hypothetical protein